MGCLTYLKSAHIIFNYYILSAHLSIFSLHPFPFPSSSCPGWDLPRVPLRNRGGKGSGSASWKLSWRYITDPLSRLAQLFCPPHCFTNFPGKTACLIPGNSPAEWQTFDLHAVAGWRNISKTFLWAADNCLLHAYNREFVGLCCRWATQLAKYHTKKAWTVRCVSDEFFHMHRGNNMLFFLCQCHRNGAQLHPFLDQYPRDNSYTLLLTLAEHRNKWSHLI